MKALRRKIRYIYGWIFVRPRRWFFHRMVCEIPSRWRCFNIHWWILYKTVFRLFSWMYWSGGSIFATQKKGFLIRKSLLGRILERIGETTVGYEITGCSECFHCGSLSGSQIELASTLNARLEGFILGGTNYQFWGIMVCPACGFKNSYQVSLL